VDALGQVFIASGDNGLVVEIPVGGSQISIGTGLQSPYGVALDAAGDVFIADYGASEVVEVPHGGAPQFTVGSGFTNPDGISVDGSGNVFVADTGNVRVLKLALTTAPKLSFAKTAPGTSSSSGPNTVIMQNIGTEALNLTSLRYPADFNQDTGGENLCQPATVLAPGLTCALTASFTPLHDGQLNENITITDDNLNAPGATQSIALSGTAAGPGAYFSSGHISFGVILVGSSSATSTVTLTNSGNEPLAILHIELTGDTSSFIVTNNCGKSLAVGASCTISGHFAPKSVGYLDATLTIDDNAQNKSQSILFSGAGGSNPVASYSVTSLTFATTGVGKSSASQQAVLTNEGNQPLSIGSIKVAGANASSFVFTNNCGSSLAAGAQCEISGYFAPKAIGPLSATIKIIDDAGNGTQTIALSGSGVALKIPVR
jgi:hypothetical protein